MANNKNNKQTRGALDTQRTDANQQYQNFLSNTGNELNNQRRESGELRNQIWQKYSSPDNFMPSGLKPNASGWFDLQGDSGGGGAAGGDFSKAKAGYSNFADTGNAGDYGSALKGYGEFASSGGVDASKLRAAAETQIPAFYDAYKNAAKRRANVQGGYSPGFDAQMAELGRESARGAFNATRQAEGDIESKVQQGKMFGVSGQGNIAGQISGNRLAGLGGLTNIGESEQSNNQFNAGLGESRNARNQQMQLALQDMFQKGGLSSAAGLSDLYKSAPGDVGQNIQAWLAGMSGKTGNELNNLGIRGSIKDTNFWTDILPGLVGSAGAAFSGMGGIGGAAGAAAGAGAQRRY